MDAEKPEPTVMKSTRNKKQVVDSYIVRTNYSESIDWLFKPKPNQPNPKLNLIGMITQ